MVLRRAIVDNWRQSHVPLTLLLGLLLLGAPPISAEEISDECRAFREKPDADLGDVMRAGCEPTLGQMSALMDNPVGNVAMLFTQFDLFRLTNDDVSGLDAEYQGNYMGILQFPKGISENWNIINRVVWNVPSVPLSQSKIDDFRKADPRRFEPTFQPAGGGPNQPPSTGSQFLPVEVFSGRTTGFGDMYYVGLLSPKKPISHGSGRKSVWGAGFDLAFPTASEDILGDGKWSAGPSALYVYLGKKWKLGGLAQQYFSFAGDSDRGDVNITNFQYLSYYSISGTISIGAGPNIIVNWEADSGNKWTVPVGMGINRTFQFGKVPVRVGLEFHYNVVRPNTVGADWNLRFYVIPAVPSALFSFLD
jgi:hypothetical protein